MKLGVKTYEPCVFPSVVTSYTINRQCQDNTSPFSSFAEAEDECSLARTATQADVSPRDTKWVSKSIKWSPAGR